MQKRLLIAGGSGLIGSAIKEMAIKEGWGVTILSRSAGNNHIQWDPGKQHISLIAPMTFDAIINLSGASLANGRWTPRRKKIILDSRIQSCATIEKYLRSDQLSAQTYIGASAIGIYGDRGSETVDENSEIEEHGDWLAQITKSWEEGHNRIKQLGIRTVRLRIGMVLSQQGGALKEMIRTAPMGFLGYFGSGQQVWSWIHIDDVAGIVLHALSNKEMEGVFLATSPFAVTNKLIISELSKVYAPSRFVLPIPTFILALMLGEMHTMLMQSCSCYPKRLVASGYKFRYPKIEKAVAELVGE